MRRKFKFVLTGFMDEYEGIIEIDQRVIDMAMSPDWQKVFYDMADANDVASMLAYNMIINNYCDFRDIEGFRGIDFEWDFVKIIDSPDINFDCMATEIIEDKNENS